MRKALFIPGMMFIPGILFSSTFYGQIKWQKVDSLYQPLPASMHVYKTTSLLDGKPNIAYYVEADLKDRQLDFTADTTFHRRITPAGFYEKNKKPLLVVNCTFFSFTTNQNLNAVITNGRLTGYNIHSINGRGKDTFTYRHPFGSAIGISKKREADIAWLYTDSTQRKPRASQQVLLPVKDSILRLSSGGAYSYSLKPGSYPDGRVEPGSGFHTWKMKTAVGGGPVLLQNGDIKITNNEELKFTGKAIDDKHPRTAMGYTNDHTLIIMVIQGRFPGIAEGATLTQEAQLFKDLGCLEALNLDGGGSSCMLINGKETIRPSDKEGQRAVPAVFIIK
jgi:Phosphodiester glycosidase